MGFIAKAQYEIPVTILAIILHHMPQDRPAADRDHRLRNLLRVISDPGSKTAAKKNHFHQKTPISLINTKKLASIPRMSELGHATQFGCMLSKFTRRD